MFQQACLSLFGMILIAFAISSAGSPPDDTNYHKALAVQAAMSRARTLLSDMNSQKAVEVLEDQLAKVNGNPQYLSLLRDAYRAYIRDLHLTGQPVQAKRYLDRLCILDPSAANDASLQGALAETPPRKFAQDPVTEKKLGFPNWQMPNLLFGKKGEPKAPPIVRAVIRAAGDDASAEDPFDRKNQREMPLDAGRGVKAREHLSRGESEFKNKRYAEARLCFEQAYEADRSSLESCREPWAYCIIKGVTEKMEQPGVLPAKLPELQKQVEGAIEMAPTKMMAVGQGLLQTLEQRAKQDNAGKPQAAASITKVKHWGENKEGWQVTETPHYRIFHRQNNEYAERVAEVAESTRTTMYRKWFGSEGVDWEPVCELILHPNAAAYTQMTGVPSNSPGHSRIESDPSGRVTARRMDLRLDINGVVEAILPHEATHVVLAGMFDAFHVPRWADEGIAVLSEPDAKIDQHRRNLLKNHKDGHLFGLKELMELKDYPHPRRIGAFYAQSVVLVEFLTQQRGAKVFTDFIKDGLRNGYETSLQRHYSMTFTQLDQLWQEQVISKTERYGASR
jgi:tetratricopeptide (TPR) repeat protein